MILPSDDMRLHISRQIIRSLGDDVVKSAEAVDLTYVSDKMPGISRVKKGHYCEYYYHNKKVTNLKTLLHIKDLVIPPAWEKVWICPLENGHLQVTGFDTKGRKQYKYHPLWIAIRSKTKFYHLLDFGKSLPCIRKRMQTDLKQRGLSREKVLATLIKLMEETNIRIGNTFYEKLYGSFGLSTFKNKHVKLNGSHIRFRFSGKKGVKHDITISNKKLAAIVRHCKELPGSELFHYYDEENTIHKICSEDINDYIHELSGKDFTSKDFRTWAGSVECIRALEKTGCASQKRFLKQNIVKALDMVSDRLGNTRAVCKKSYVHPKVLACYEMGRLEKYFRQIVRDRKWMAREEIILMKMLKSSEA